ncbi:MAG: sulfatase-like hydrolase/transferase [Bryobacteraceae bacterium]|nr:sulfatase-like hydrolase/transferase [Bryobacteraceae bacterium]
MTRREFVGMACAGLAAPARAAERPPNFLIIYADDLGIGDLGCYGARDVKTPNIDKLAAAGARFTDWYTNSPVCSPSRASLLTGKYPQRTGVTEVLASTAQFETRGLARGEITLPGELRKRGYRTGHIGKWHLGSAPESRPSVQGYDEFFGFYSGWADYYSHRYYRQGRVPQEIFHDLWRNEREEFRDGEYHTEMFGAEAAAFLSRQQSGTPFFLTAAFGAVHYPMMAPQKYLDRFSPQMDRERRMHAAVTAAMDDAVGLIVETLSRRGLLDNTVIFFQSDNGATNEIRAHSRAMPYRGGSNAPFRGFKAGLFEGGIRMPAILAWNGRIPGNRSVSGVAGAMDIFPTFLNWAGATQPYQVDGKNIAAMAQQGAPSPHDAFFWGYLKQRAVREGPWKLILNPPSVPGDPVESDVWLSNLAEDPAEQVNLAKREPERTARLQKRIEDWFAGFDSARSGVRA